MKVLGYYVCTNGLTWTVVEVDGKTVNNVGNEVIVIGNIVQVGHKEPDSIGFRIDDEYTLHKTLTELANIIEE